MKTRRKKNGKKNVRYRERDGEEDRKPGGKTCIVGPRPRYIMHRNTIRYQISDY